MSAEQQRGPARVYRTRSVGIEVQWEPRLCIHSRNCVRNLGAVFDPERRPWVDADAADPDAVAAAVETCPTGALHYVRTDGGPQEAAGELTVTPMPKGPLFLRGHVRIQDAGGNVIREDTRVALCRCGASGNKPFCDGSHNRIGFDDTST
jgi:uncharacterized Fe-S cluster protein YjdI/CDGSH-type Zn-finger protein